MGVGDWDWRMCCKTVLQNAGNYFRAQLKIFIIEKERGKVWIEIKYSRWGFYAVLYAVILSLISSLVVRLYCMQ